MLPMLEVVGAQDGERIRRIVRGSDKPIALVGLKNCRVAVAGEDLGMDVLGEQRPPRERGRGMLYRIGKDVRQARSEIV